MILRWQLFITDSVLCIPKSETSLMLRYVVSDPTTLAERSQREEMWVSYLFIIFRIV